MILNIETSTTVCSIAVQDNDVLLGSFSLFLEKSHASILPMAIGQLLGQVGVHKRELTAIAVSAGPGSYTGLRIGTSTAKGLAYALSIPLISVSSLDTMIEQIPTGLLNVDDMLLPMIDARRMEVYTKATTVNRKVVFETQAKVLEGSSFSEYSDKRLILFGNGATKAHEILLHPSKVAIKNMSPSATGMVKIAHEKFVAGIFEDVAYFEPMYLKEFQTKKSKDLLKP